MERELWPLLYCTVRDIARGFSQKYVQIPSWVLIVTMLWASLHDRPVSWACRAANWETTRLRPWRLPSASTMSRRVDGEGAALLWQAVEQRLRDLSGTHPALAAFLDGKPLPVSGVSKDCDACYGHGAGLNAKGYKLHTVWSTRTLPETWEVTPLNISEKVVARRLIPPLSGGGYLLADGNYDANPLFDLAGAQGYQLVTPLPRGAKPGSGHHYQSPYRLRSIALMQSPFGKRLYRCRTAIERSYGNATSFGGGMGPLPAWVRGLDRVRTWVWAKLLINASRILKNKGLRSPLQNVVNRWAIVACPSGTKNATSKKRQRTHTNPKRKRGRWRVIANASGWCPGATRQSSFLLSISNPACTKRTTRSALWLK
jgi:hypothetical protein